MRVLPIQEKKDAIVELIERNQVVILSSETGTGKTTQVPRYVYEMYAQPVICSQPRRIAAISIAKRVAEEMGTALGQLVGYSVRFEERACEDTMIRYVTDGTLLREFIEDTTLSKYKAVIIDEVHERTINIDLLLGLVKDAIEIRKDLKVIIMSATISTERFQSYLQGAAVFHIKSRTFPIAVKYMDKPAVDYVVEAVSRAIEIHETSPPGDILVFLTGEDEIEKSCKEIEFRKRGTPGLADLLPLPLYSSLPLYAQNAIFGATRGRKVIFATNIAETSITIESVVYVIDSGFAKQKIYDSSMKSEMLLKLPISRSSADQRKGRAGRVRDGVCYRLYDQKTYEDMEHFNIPEILRGELSALILKMVRMGIKNLVTFDFIEPPLPESVIVALNQLYFLGAIDQLGNITEDGAEMVEFPLEPRQSKAILASVKYNVEEEVVTILSMTGNMIYDKRKVDEIVDETSDHVSYYFMMKEFERLGGHAKRKFCFDNGLNEKNMENALKAKRQLLKILDKVKSGRSLRSGAAKFGRRNEQAVREQIGLALLEGYLLQSARIFKGKSAILSGTGAKVSVRRLLPPAKPDRLGRGGRGGPCGSQWVVYGELTKMDGKYVIRMVSNVSDESFCRIQGENEAKLKAIEFATNLVIN